MTLDSRLNWEEHIDRVRTKAKRALNTIKIVASKKWERDRRTLKRLYSAVYRSKMVYDCQLYSTASAWRLKKLNSIHRNGIKICRGTFRISPVNSLHAEACNPTMELKRNKLGLR